MPGFPYGHGSTRVPHLAFQPFALVGLGVQYRSFVCDQRSVFRALLNIVDRVQRDGNEK